MKKFPNGNRPTRSLYIFVLFLVLSVTYGYGQEPVITTFSPIKGVVGTSVTITGTGFNTMPANNIVFFGAVRAAVTAAGTTSLTVTAPRGATYGALTILNTGTGLQAQSPGRFLTTFTPSKLSIAASDFSAKVDFPTGTNPHSLAISDIDGDGKPDLVIANYNDNTVSVLLNTGSPGSVSFAARVDMATGINPASVAIGDINGDGKPDLVIANKGSNTISILLNTSSPGSISFAAKIDLATGLQPMSVAIGDLDGDGKPDVGVVNYRSNTVSLYRNTSSPGSLSFAAKVDSGAGLQPRFIAIADINADGKPDLVISSQGTHTVVFLQNYGSPGSFHFLVEGNLDSVTDPQGITIGDIDGDGYPEITTASGSDNNISVRAGFPPQGVNFTFYGGTFATGHRPVSVAIGDMDGDGRADLVTANANSQTVSVLRNGSVPGSLNIAGKIDLATGLNPFSVAVGDMDGDGKPDIIVVNAGSNTVSVMRNNPVILTPPVITSFSPSSGVVGSTVTIHGTGFNTTAANNIVFFGATRATVTGVSATALRVTVPMGATYAAITVLNKTTGLAAFTSRVFQPTFTPGTGGITGANFAPRVDYPIGQGLNPVAIGDIDGDGKPDIVTSNNNNVSVLRNTGHLGRGSFAPKVDVLPYPSISVILADIDGDGKLDLVLSGSVMLNTSSPGRISFAPLVGLTAGAYAVTDIDGDGKPDVIGIDSQNGVCVLRNTSSPGSASFDAPVEMTTAYDPRHLVVGDLDGDGKPDIVAVAASSFWNSYISVLRNTSSPGNISFTPRTDIQVGTIANSHPEYIIMGDIDGDSRPDLVLTNIGDGDINVLRNTSNPGSLSFAAEADFTVYAPRQVAIGDIDGDGKPDLAVAKYGGVAILRNVSSVGNVGFAAEVPFTSQITGPINGPTNAFPWDIAVGDLDGDGKPDVATTIGGAVFNVSVLNSGQTWPGDAGIKSILLSTGSTLTYLSTTGNVLHYTASVTAATTSLTVTPTATNPQATITVNGIAVPSGTASQSIALNTSPTIINIEVTAQDGVTQKNYSISIYKNGSSNAGVDLKLSDGSLLNLMQNSNTYAVTNYSTSTGYDTLRVTPTAADPNASITVNGVAVPSGTASQNIVLVRSAAIPIITVQVTAQDGVTKRTYQIYVYRNGSSDASFKSVQLSAGSSQTYLSGSLTFLSSSYNIDYYSASVPAGTASVALTTVPRGPGATITVDAMGVAAGAASQNIPLTSNPTIITIQIIANDHITTRTRSIAIYKNKSSDVGLNSVVLSTGSTIINLPRSNNVDYYYASVPPATTSLTVIPTASDPNAAITVDGSAVTSGTASQSIALATNPTVVNIQVTAEDGINTQMRSITIYKNGASDARMKSIVLSTGPRMKRLDVQDNVYYYSATVPDSITSLTVTPTVNDPNATITVDGVPVVSGTASQSIALGSSPIEIHIVGTAQDGITTKTYSITVTRAVPPLNSAYEQVSVSIPAERPQLMGEELTVHQYISPNGDGINDFLIIEGITSYPDNTLTIMNRAGQVVFEAKNYDNSTKVFDGHSTKTGAMQLPGTYFYSLDYNVKGLARHKTGYIVLKY